MSSIKVEKSSSDRECKPLKFQINYDQTSRLKFEKIDHARSNQDPTAVIKSERLYQMNLMPQQL